MSGPIRETSRLRLRGLRRGDEDAVYTVLSDERVVRFMLFRIFTRARAERFVARMQSAAGTGDPPQIVLAIVGRSDDRLIGICGIVLRPELEEGEIWYLLRLLAKRVVASDFHPDRVSSFAWPPPSWCALFRSDGYRRRPIRARQVGCNVSHSLTRTAARRA